MKRCDRAPAPREHRRRRCLSSGSELRHLPVDCPPPTPLTLSTAARAAVRENRNASAGVQEHEPNEAVGLVSHPESRSRREAARRRGRDPGLWPRADPCQRQRQGRRVCHGVRTRPRGTDPTRHRRRQQPRRRCVAGLACCSLCRAIPRTLHLDASGAITSASECSRRCLVFALLTLARRCRTSLETRDSSVAPPEGTPIGAMVPITLNAHCDGRSIASGNITVRVASVEQSSLDSRHGCLDSYRARRSAGLSARGHSLVDGDAVVLLSGQP